MSERERLTKRAADAVGDKGTGIMNDPYQVNNPEHEKNDPAIGEYAKGDPSAWAEDVNKDLPGGPKDKRDPDTHIPEITAKMAAEAIQAGRKLEEKAVKCIVAAQRILPGAEDTVVESQAADLMHLPDNMVDSMLGRQEALATSIAKAAAEACEDTKKDDEKEKDKEKDAASEEKKDEEKKEEKDAAKSPEEKKAWAEKMKALRDKKAAIEAEIADAEKAAGDIPEGLKKFQEEKKEKAEGDKPEDKDEDKEKDAAKKDKKEEKKDEKKDEKKEEKAEEKDAAKDEKKDEEKKDEDKEKDAASETEEKKDEEKKDEDKEKDASQTLLDDIFSGVIASDNKKGAKSLSGLVKKEASESGTDPLAGIWKTDPDVSDKFR